MCCHDDESHYFPPPCDSARCHFSAPGLPHQDAEDCSQFANLLTHELTCFSPSCSLVSLQRKSPQGRRKRRSPSAPRLQRSQLNRAQTHMVRTEVTSCSRCPVPSLKCSIVRVEQLDSYDNNQCINISLCCPLIWS